MCNVFDFAKTCNVCSSANQHSNMYNTGLHTYMYYRPVNITCVNVYTTLVYDDICYGICIWWKIDSASPCIELILNLLP